VQFVYIFLNGLGLNNFGFWKVFGGEKKY